MDIKCLLAKPYHTLGQTKAFLLTWHSCAEQLQDLLEKYTELGKCDTSLLEATYFEYETIVNAFHYTSFNIFEAMRHITFHFFVIKSYSLERIWLSIFCPSK